MSLMSRWVRILLLVACVSVSVSGAWLLFQQRANEEQWHITVYYTPVESFHAGPKQNVRGCLVQDCEWGQDALGSYPADFIEKVKNEGAGRITSGAYANKYLNWSYNAGYWLDTIPANSYGGKLQPFVTAAADPQTLSRGVQFKVTSCGDHKTIDETVCDKLKASTWQIADEFTPGLGGERHIDLYIGEEAVPAFEESSQYLDIADASIGVLP